MTNFLVNLLKVVLGLSVLTFIISIWILNGIEKHLNKNHKNV